MLPTLPSAEQRHFRTHTTPSDSPETMGKQCCVHSSLPVQTCLQDPVLHCTNPTVLCFKDCPIPSVNAHCEGPSWNRVPTLKPHRWPFPFAIPRLLTCLVIWLCSTKWSEVSGSCTQTVFSLAFLLGRPAPKETVTYSIGRQDHTGIYMSSLQDCLRAEAETSLSAIREVR